MAQIESYIADGVWLIAAMSWGVIWGEYRYRKLLLRIAKIGMAEKLPDGKFYYIVSESSGDKE